MVSEQSQRPTAIIDADLSILLADKSECQKQLQRFWENKDRDSMTFFIVQDCWERACERQQKDSQQLPSKLSEFLDIEILRNDHINEDDLQEKINYIRQNINKGQIEKDEDSTIELAYAIVFGCSELVTHKIDEFLVYKYDSLPVRIRRINPNTEPESKTDPEPKIDLEPKTYSDPKTKKNPISLLVQLFRQLWSNLGFLKYLICFISGLFISVFLSMLIPVFFLQPSPSICDSTSSCYFFSSGERRLMTTTIRENSHRLFEIKKYQEAYKKLKLDWEKTQDPETLIYLNNAFLEREKEDFNTIAVLVPISQKIQTNVNEDRDLAKEILRGVAQAQTTHHANIFNKDVFNWNTDNNSDQVNFHFLSTENQPKSRKKGIRVIIVDDENDSDGVKNLTRELVKRDDIKAFVGHYSSDLTVKAVNIYNQHRKVLISPGNSTEELSENNYEYFFRTVPSAKYQAELLLDYIDKEINPENKNTKNVAVCYVSSSPFSKSIHDEFQKLLGEKHTRGIKEIKYKKCIGTDRNDTFSGSEFKAEEALQEMDEADILVLFPDGQTSKSMENAVNLIKENKGDKYILGSWNLRNNRTLKTLEEVKKALEDRNKDLQDEKLVLAVPWEYPSPTNDYAEDVEKLWKGPVGPITALSHDTTQALISTMDNDTQSLQESLKDSSHEGVTGEISFDRCGNRKSNPMFLVKVVEEGNYSLKFEKISKYSGTFSGIPEKCQDKNN